MSQLDLDRDEIIAQSVHFAKATDRKTSPISLAAKGGWVFASCATIRRGSWSQVSRGGPSIRKHQAGLESDPARRHSKVTRHACVALVR